MKIKKFKRENAITLVALIVTLIILAILAGVTIAILSNTNLFNNAKLAKEEWNNSTRNEEEMLSKYSNEIYLATTREETITINKSDYEQMQKDIEDLKTKTINKSDYEQMQKDIEDLKTKESSITLDSPNDWSVVFNKVVKNGNQVTIIFGGTYKNNFNNTSVKIGTLPYIPKYTITDSGAVSTVDVHQIKNMLYVYLGKSGNINVADWGATSGKTIVINTTYICN